MSDHQIRVGEKRACWSARGNRILKYVVEMSHEGLNEHKVISAPTEYMLDYKIMSQKRKWTEKWRTISFRRKINVEKEANLSEANRRTEDAVNSLKNIEDILVYSLSVNNVVDWENLKKKEIYPEHEPINQFQNLKGVTHPSP